MGEGAQALLAGLPGTGQVIAGKYVIERVLAVGGMGAVLSAHDRALDRRVAIKFMLPKALGSADVRARFLREARAAVAIRSEHVVDIYEVGVTPPDMPFIVMEYLPGRDLHRFLESRAGLLPVAETVDYVLQACEALAEAHSLGIVHRDVKPSNFFVTHRPDGSALIKILDFGISKTTGLMRFEEQSKSLTQSSVALGSPLYMSPEQVRNSKFVDARTDIWSIGVVLYELLAKELPFDGETVPSLAAAIASDVPKPLRHHRPDVPAQLEAVIMRCLEKDPAKRYQTVGHFARALLPFAPPDRRPISFDNIEATGGGDLAFMSTTERPSPLSEAERAAMASGKITIDAKKTTTAGLGTTQRIAERRRSVGLFALGAGAMVFAGVVFMTLSKGAAEAVPAATARADLSATAPPTPSEPARVVELPGEKTESPVAALSATSSAGTPPPLSPPPKATTATRVAAPVTKKAPAAKPPPPKPQPAPPVASAPPPKPEVPNLPPELKGSR